MKAFLDVLSIFTLARHDGEKLQAEGAERLYNIYLYEKDGTRMHLVFRDHHISDLIGFVYSGMAAQEAADTSHPKH